jgi:gluconolactonase
LWFTDYGKRRPRDTDYGGVYYIEPHGRSIREVVFPLQPANGIGLSPDEKTLYVSETPTARLWAFDIGESGTIVPSEPVYMHEKGRCLAGLGGYQMFDSLAVEANGNVCVATLASGCISVISPEGKLLEQYKTGDPFTTNVAFGGPDFSTAFITLSSKGELVAVDWGRAGHQLNFYGN